MNKQSFSANKFLTPAGMNYSAVELQRTPSGEFFSKHSSPQQAAGYSASKIKLFLISFLVLFLELSLIRYVPANIKLVGFFSNIVLMATFTGLGAGLLLSTKRNYTLGYFSSLLLLLVLGLSLGPSGLNTNSGGEVIFFDSLVKSEYYLEPWFVLPLIYLCVALVFVPLGQLLKQSFASFSPLTAYSIDILGSISGILLFTLLSFFSTPAWLWFLVISLISYYILYFKDKTGLKYLHLIILIALIVVVFSFNRGSVFSPYYKITVYKQTDTAYGIVTNNIPHQFINDYHYKEPFYFVPYERFSNPVYKKVLIIGAGTGVDTAVTLGDNPQVELVDAVEIDPVILNYGKTLNPNQPYSNPKVRLHNTDGREFLQTTDQKYDLIIFALTDSLTLLSNSANIRLESFLYTTETFALAKEHLTDNGLFTLYNYYREPWLVKKLGLMLNQTFGSTNVHVIEGTITGRAATLLAGPKLKDLKTEERLTAKTKTLPLAEDDWPFLYMKSKILPTVYLSFLTGVLVITLAFIAVAIYFSKNQSASKKFSFDFRLFFFGAGFLLLETKSLATFSLLFGSTWLVNSLVFSAILVFVLIANLLSYKLTFKHLSLFYTALFGMLILSYLIPPSYFFKFERSMRLLSASAFYFSPIMLANIIFSQEFKKTTNSAVSFGSNMFGAVFGAVFEYASLITGYKALTIFIVLFYILSLVKFNRSSEHIS